VVSWPQTATPAAWTPPQPVPGDLAREVEARVMRQIQQLLPELVAQALQASLQARASGADN
jgi:hypothetical protein